jgi:hypothetical protein
MTNIKNNNPHVVDDLTKKIGISTYPVFEKKTKYVTFFSIYC